MCANVKMTSDKFESFKESFALLFIKNEVAWIYETICWYLFLDK